jgi:hypothetical protein
LTGANNEPVLQKKKRKNKGKEILPPADLEALIMQEPEVNEYVLLLNFVFLFFLYTLDIFFIKEVLFLFSCAGFLKRKK